MAVRVTADTRVLKNPVTGDLQEVPAAKAREMAAAGRLVGATPEEIDQHNLAERRGTPGQVAQGLAETGVRAATLGNVESLDGDTEGARERAQFNEREHPALDTAASFVPGAAAAVGAGVATGGLGLAAGIAAQGAAGGLTNLSAAQEEAFRNDQSLSTEAAWGSFGSGVLLGAASEVAGAALARGAGAVRNRFVEAASSSARRAEQSAFESAGIVRPAKDLAKAVDDPIRAATFRAEANEARASVQPELDSALADADAAHAHVASTVGSGLELEGDVAGDVFHQRHAVRDIVVGLRDDLNAASGTGDGVASQVMEALDRAETQPQIYQMLQKMRGTLDAAADTSDNPAMVRILQKYSKQADELAQSKSTWGTPAENTAAATKALQDAQQARAMLQDALSKTDYPSTVGTAGGKPVDDAIANYSERLEAVLKGNGSPEAEQGLQALGRLRELTDGKLRAVAAGNQVDALAKTVVPGKGPTGMAADIGGELAETAAEMLVPGVGLVRKAWKYRRQIAQLAGGARATTDRTALAMLARSPSRAAERVLGGRLPTAIGSAAQGARRGAATASFFSSLDSKPEKAYAKVRESVQQLHQHPEQLMAALSQQMGDLPTEAPELHEAIAAQSARVVEFLNSKIPPSFGFSMLYPDGPPPSRSDILELSLYWSGCTDGEGTMKRMANGHAMPEEVEAFRAAFPAWYAELQETTVIKAQEMARDGHVLGAFQISNLENTLDLSGQLDPTFSGSIAQIYQTADAIEADSRQQSVQNGPPPKAGDRVNQKASIT